MVYKVVLLVSAAVLLCGLADCIYTDCGSVDGTIVNVVISKCAADAKRCILRRNTNASMEITFTSNVDSDSLTAVVHGVILSVEMPFELPNPNGCKDSGIECPIKAGTTYKYITEMPVSGSYPRVTVDIKWELKTIDKKDIICALIPAKIQ